MPQPVTVTHTQTHTHTPDSGTRGVMPGAFVARRTPQGFPPPHPPHVLLGHDVNLPPAAEPSNCISGGEVTAWPRDYLLLTSRRVAGAGGFRTVQLFERGANVMSHTD